MTTNPTPIPEPTSPTAVTRARELLDKATPGPWEAATCHESEQETRSEYVRSALLKPDAPAHGLWMAWKPDSRLGVHLTAVTGDGPHGEADAELIAAAPTLLAELADEVDRLRAALNLRDTTPEPPENAAWHWSLISNSDYTKVCAENARMRALTAVDEAMVERAARAVYGAAFADATGWDMANQSMRDTCRTLSNAALDAALGVES